MPELTNQELEELLALVARTEVQIASVLEEVKACRELLERVKGYENVVPRGPAGRRRKGPQDRRSGSTR